MDSEPCKGPRPSSELTLVWSRCRYVCREAAEEVGTALQRQGLAQTAEPSPFTPEELKEYYGADVSCATVTLRPQKVADCWSLRRPTLPGPTRERLRSDLVDLAGVRARVFETFSRALARKLR